MKKIQFSRNYFNKRGTKSAFLEKLVNAQVTVVGMARAGLAVARLLKQVGANVTVVDSKPADRLIDRICQFEDMGVKVVTVGYPVGLFTGSDLVVVSPGVPYHHEHVSMGLEKGVPVISEIELAYHYFPGRIIAVTGTNGKTTTTTLIGECCSVEGFEYKLCGNIGYPLSAAVLESDSETVMVAEVSSFQLERIVFFRPDVGIMLNIFPDHMDRYTTMDEYLGFKYRVTENQLETDHLILNQDIPEVAALAEKTNANTWFFSINGPVEQGIYLKKDTLVIRDKPGDGGVEVCSVDDIKIPGTHNVQNVMASLVAARIIGVGTGSARKAITRFKGVKHRLEFIRELDGVKYYDDTPGTNIAAVKAALNTFSEPIILIAGGKSKGTDFSLLAPIVREKVKTLILFGESRNQMKEQMGLVNATREVGSLEEAVKIARGLAEPGDVVLLSPVCASFDMFRDYVERGEKFKEYVQEF